jgi:uncharacterized membrane protein YjfL (UPF0719 family)
MKIILIAGVAQLVSALVLAPLVSNVAFRLFDASTDELSERDELRKGNVAVGIALAAVIGSTGLVVREAMRPAHDALVLALSPGGSLWAWGASVALHVALALAFATFGVVFGARIFAALVGDRKPFEHLRTGNAAYALVLGAAILVTGSLVAEATGPIFEALIPYPSAVSVRIGGERR